MTKTRKPKFDAFAFACAAHWSAPLSLVRKLIAANDYLEDIEAALREAGYTYANH